MRTLTTLLTALAALALLLVMPAIMLLAAPWLIISGRSLRSCCREANAMSGMED